MKKSLLIGFFSVVSLVGVSYAAVQWNWGTSNGGAWNTPDDTSNTVGAPIQMGGTNSAIAVAGGAPTTIYSRTVAQLTVLTPATTGQIVYCSNCVQSVVCVSTGIGNGAWVNAVSSSSTNALAVCK